MPDYLFISAQEFQLQCFGLGRKVLESDFKPTFVAGIWRGGAAVGIAVQEFLKYHGLETNHIPIRTSAYEGIDRMQRQVKVYALDYLVDKASPEDRVLLVDDVFDTGLSMGAVIRVLHEQMGKDVPKDIRIATVYYKPERNKTSRVPDYYVHTATQWLVFPHELEGLTEEEIRQGKGEDVAKVVLGK